jgi:Ca2+-transporting ATPase
MAKWIAFRERSQLDEVPAAERRAPTGSPAVAAPHAVAPGEVVDALGSEARAGLSEREAIRRLADLGPNEPSRTERPPYLALAGRQFLDPLVALLLAAAGVSAALGDELEAAAIGAIVLLNAVFGFLQEAAAERAVLALRNVFTQLASVIRDGQEREIPAAEVVVGDLLVLREGERVPADARIVSAERLAADESALTGESLPVAKSLDPVAPETPLAERSGMVFAGTAVTRGRATAVVTATGDASELGTISELAAGAERPPTPLQRRLGRLARLMVALGVGVTVVLAAGMVLRGSSLHEAFLVGVAVAVAAVPKAWRQP